MSDLTTIKYLDRRKLLLIKFISSNLWLIPQTFFKSGNIGEAEQNSAARRFNKKSPNLDKSCQIFFSIIVTFKSIIIRFKNGFFELIFSSCVLD